MMAKAVVLAACAIGAAIAVLTGVGPAIGQGFAVGKACEAVGRQPEAQGGVRSTLILGCALAETTGIYAFIIALLLLFFAPGQFIGLLG